MFETKSVEKIKTHILCSTAFFFFQNRAIYEIMQKSIVDKVVPHMTTWHMRTACWIPEATNMHSEYVILIAVPL